MNFFKLVFAGVSLFPFFLQPVFSQQSVLNPVIVTGTLSEQYLSDALASVTLISRDEIEKSQSASLADLLQGEAGIEFGRNGGIGSTTSFFLRGQASKNIAVYVDGVRSPVDQVGAIQITDFPLAQIEKIEILRGNASALYGDAAIGGVINIFTRQGSGPPKPHASVSIGSHGYQEVTAGYGGVIKTYKFNLQLGSQKSTGFSAMNTDQKTLANPDADGQMAQYFSLNLEKKIAANTSLGLRLNHSNSENQYDYATVFDNPLRTDLHKQLKVSDSQVIYLHSNLSTEWKTKLDISNNQIQYDDYLNGAINATYYGFGRNKGNQQSLRWFNTYAINDQALANFGVDYSEDQLQFTGTDSNSDSYEMKRLNRGMFTGVNQSFGQWTVQANIRRDELQVGNTNANAVVSKIKPDSTSGLIGIGYSLDQNWKINSSFSNGFSAPTAYDVSQDARLTPEKFQAKEIGFSYASDKQLFRVVYFEMDTKNSIDYDDIFGVVSNAYASSNKGFESTGQAQWNGLKFKGSLVVQNPWNITYNEALARRAKRYGTLDLSQRFDVYEVGAKLYASSERKDSHYNNNMLKSYSALSVYGSRQFGKDWIARVKVHNLFNERYQLAYGYNTPGRTLMATLAYQLH
jgi:vitamin B12 transporter